jgi:hypothetical protein
MKKIFTFIGVALLLASAAHVQAQIGVANALYPGLTDSTLVYKAPRATTPPVIDGNPTDAVWQLAPWKSAMRVANYNNAWSTTERVEPAGPFSGVADCEFKYKFIWDNDRYYMLMYWKDDNVIYADNHNGYGRTTTPTGNVTVTNSVPAAGNGDGTAYQSWNMDQIAIFLVNYYEPFTTAVQAFNRGNNSLWYNFYPAVVTKEPKVDWSVLWTQANNLPTGGTIQKTRSACKYDAVEKAYYIEFADTTWTALFKTVKNQFLTATAPTIPQKDFSVTPVAVGDKFLFSGEINDADGTTDRRDYSLFISAKLTDPNSKATEAVVIELVETVPQGLSNPKANNSLDIYPNVTAGNTISLTRAADVQFFNLSGRMMLESKNAIVINISSLKQGVYMVKDNAGNVNKLIRQ